MNEGLQWLAGIGTALVIGAPATWLFSKSLKKHVGVTTTPLEHAEILRMSPWITGTVERAFFLVIIAFDISGAATAMIGWLTLKMVTNWNRSSRAEEHFISPALVSLLSGLVSMLFAVLGGLICRGKIG